MQNCDDECSPLRIEHTASGDTVFYKNRYLYSKRQPKKQIESLVASLVPQERTLFIFASPLLGYGATQLINLLPTSSFLLFIEYDEHLGTLFESVFWKEFIATNAKDNIAYLCVQDVNIALQRIEAKTRFNFKKIEMIRGSAGFSLYENFYAHFLSLLENEMGNFWKNRITLIEMARLYSRNIFKWLRYILTNKKRFKTLPKHLVEKPILVLGAGPSLDASLAFIKENRSKFFLLAVDVALPSLSSIQVQADAVVLLEGQYWVEYAFLLSRYKTIPVFASITSNPHVFNIFQGDIFLYAIEFASMLFLQNLNHRGFNFHSFTPLGSVGLLALQLALFMAKKDMPIFHTGLDFSYNQGFSHARSSMHPQNITIGNTRLQGLYSGTTFPIGAKKIEGKEGKLVWSTPILASYASIYKSEFFSLKNIFDLGKTGVILRETVLKEREAKNLIENLQKEEMVEEAKNIKLQEGAFLQTENLQSFLDEEREKLMQIKNMLIGAKVFNGETLLKAVKQSDYLYLHFPDYPSLSDAQMLHPSFLKRIRIEIEYFLKL